MMSMRVQVLHTYRAILRAARSFGAERLDITAEAREAFRRNRGTTDEASIQRQVASLPTVYVQ